MRAVVFDRPGDESVLEVGEVPSPTPGPGEVLIRVAMANDGPIGSADLLSIFRRIVAVTRALETRDRAHDREA